MPTVHSYDVFDTVLTRVVGDPDAVIDVVAEPSHKLRIPVAAL